MVETEGGAVVSPWDIPPDQAVTPSPPGGPPPLQKTVVAIVGPFSDQILVMPEAEADQALADEWARPLPLPEDYVLPDPSEDARLAAYLWAAEHQGQKVAPPEDSVAPATARATDEKAATFSEAPARKTQAASPKPSAAAKAAPRG